MPKGTLVYEIEGPMFFAVADQFLNVSMDKDTKVVVMRMRSVPAMDVSALRKLQEVYKMCEKHHVTLLFLSCDGAAVENDGESRIHKGSWGRKFL